LSVVDWGSTIVGDLKEDAVKDNAIATNTTICGWGSVRRLYFQMHAINDETVVN